VDSSAGLRVGAAFESILLAPLLEALFPGADALGAYGATLMAVEVASHDRPGFAGLVAAALQGDR
jgi:hypothetical protein